MTRHDVVHKLHEAVWATAYYLTRYEKENKVFKRVQVLHNEHIILLHNYTNIEHIEL